MKTMLSAGRFVFAVGMAVSLSGCESGEPFGSLEPTPEATFADFEAEVLAQAQSSGIDVDAVEAVKAPGVEASLQLSRAPREWVFVQGSAGDGSVEAVIGPRGGVLNLGPHWLLVPRRAVTRDVLFRMTAIPDGTYHVELTATTVGSLVENDVGSTGLRRPVLLGIQYGDIDVDPSSLRIAWLSDAGLVIQPTYIFEDANGDEWAVGVLQHFSGYILVAN